MSRKLHIDDTEEDLRAYRAAVEAVLGVTVHGDENPDAIHNWLHTVFDGDVSLVAKATHYAERIIRGPLSAKA